jgi:hypothetical protein
MPRDPPPGPLPWRRVALRPETKFFLLGCIFLKNAEEWINAGDFFSQRA